MSILYPLSGGIALNLGTLQIDKNTIFSYGTSVRYIDGPLPNAEEYFLALMGGDKIRVIELQKCLGHCLLQPKSNNSLYVFYGIGSNGKTILLKILRKIMTKLLFVNVTCLVKHKILTTHRLAILNANDINDSLCEEDCNDLLNQTDIIVETNHYPYKLTKYNRMQVIEFPMRYVVDPKKATERKRDDTYVAKMHTEHLSEVFSWIARGAHMHLNL